MRIMLDTNVLISALFFPTPSMQNLMYKVTTQYHLVLSSYVVEELLSVTQRKFKNKLPVVDMLLNQLSYELVYTPENPPPGLVYIRDEKDYPVLYSAVAENVDVLITGDKDFSDIIIDSPEILTIAEFLEKY